MRKLIVLTLTSLMLATPGGLIATASAQDLRIELGQGGVRVDRDRDRDRDRRDRDWDRRDRDRGCSEGRALDKAERMGLRRVRIDRVGRRTIEVTGRDRRGDRRSVTFGRERGCPVY
jgi:hypothetical protein